VVQHPFVNMGIRAARRAGDVIFRSLNRLESIEVYQKSRNDFVSEVDRMAETEIMSIISAAYPDHGFLAEESGLTPGKMDDYVWIIDPLDGTTNFLHGFPQFCVSIACAYRGRTEHAIIYDPIRQELFTCSRGAGAMLDDRRIRVSKARGLEGTLIATGFPFRANTEWMDEYLQMLKVVMESTAGVRRPGSAALDLAWLAAGRTDAYFEMGLSPWDTAAGALLVEEAGGRVSRLNGEAYHNDSDILAGSPKTYEALLDLLRPHLPQSIAPTGD